MTAALDEPGTDLQAVLVERGVQLPHGVDRFANALLGNRDGDHIRKGSHFQGNETTR